MGYLYDKNGYQVYDCDGNAIAVSGADYNSTHSGAEIDAFIPQIVFALFITNYTANRISAVTGKDTSTVTFQSNQALQAWEARADGAGHGQGDLVGSGGALNAWTNQQFDVENEELTWGDKIYQINVYGQNSSGDWSEYES